MMRSLFAGVSGLSSQQLKMDVIGNNISNVSTVGFKGSRIRFNEQFNQLLAHARQSLTGGSVNPIQIGRGVLPGAVDRQFLQGILQSTGLQTDLGIQGTGFFVVGDDTRQFYTRAGNFHFESDGRLVTSGGLFVKGRMADSTGQIPESASLENITLDPTLAAPAIPTSEVRLAGNLDASARRVQETWTLSQDFTIAATGEFAVGTTQLNELTQTTTPLVDGDTIVISGANPDGSEVSATFTYGGANDGTTLDDLLSVINGAFTGATATLEEGSIVIKDDVPGSSDLRISLAVGENNTGFISLAGFVNSAAGFTPSTVASTLVYDSLGAAHTLTVTFRKGLNPRDWQFEVTLDGDETVSGGGSGTLSFASDGSLDGVIFDQAQSVFTFDPNNGGDLVSINLDFGAGSDLGGLTLFEGLSNVTIPSQNGQAQGRLSSFVIDESGRIFGSFTNGANRLIAQVALAQFNNPSGMNHIGNNLFEATTGSGDAQIGLAGEDFESAIFSGTLEASNVDLAEEFTEMIIAQRAFQANARTITVADQFLNEVVQLKR